MKTIAVDFDGVIHAYSKGWADGSIYDKPVPGALETLVKLAKHYAVFILSTRDSNQILEWMVHQGFKPHDQVRVVPPDVKFWNEQGVIGITDRKLVAIAYIDDRAVRFTNWTDVANYFA